MENLANILDSELWIRVFSNFVENPNSENAQFLAALSQSCAQTVKEKSDETVKQTFARAVLDAVADKNLISHDRLVTSFTQVSSCDISKTFSFLVDLSTSSLYPPRERVYRYATSFFNPDSLLQEIAHSRCVQKICDDIDEAAKKNNSTAIVQILTIDPTGLVG